MELWYHPRCDEWGATRGEDIDGKVARVADGDAQHATDKTIHRNTKTIQLIFRKCVNLI